MDAEERELRLQEFEAQRRTNRFNTRMGFLSLLVSLTAVVGTIVFSTLQLHASSHQFRDGARDTHYNEIVTGLGSSAAAVQTNSMRLLTDFVEQRSNYPSVTAQRQGALDAMQTLAAFIEDQSTARGFSGLSNYTSPQPIVLSRAMDQLKRLSTSWT